MTEKKLWSGRFTESTDHQVELFTASIDIDKKLYDYDIDGSIAHCKMLARCQIIPQSDADSIIRGLEIVREEIRSDNFSFDIKLEDIHMHIESRLAQIIGSAALKLHTARSRNDQVALDTRMYLRDAVQRVMELLFMCRKIIVASARQHKDVILPGYTHLQRAQPVLLAHHFMAYYEMLSRDQERMADAFKRINVMPLGSAALAGTTYPIDRAYCAELLGFPKISANSMDSVADRDFIIEFLSAASICMVHLSRLSEELILWSSSEFGFIQIPDRFATGSSIMPQKKNPDVPELIRGKTGRVFGSLISVLTIMKSLPLAYNRDMQEDKQPLFDTVNTLTSCLEMLCGLLPGLHINRETMMNAASTGFLNATDLADYLVRKGISFREAHHLAGSAVARCLPLNKELHELTLDELKAISPEISQDIYIMLDTRQIVDRRLSFGGTAANNVLQAIETAEQELTG